MDIGKLIDDNRCIKLKSRTKTESILELIDLAEESGVCGDIENLQKEIFYREQIMSTGIGQGLAIPHVRFHGIKEPSVFIGINPMGIPDYDSLDGEVVRIVVMILVNETQHKEYLRILSLIVSALKNKGLQDKLLQCDNIGETLRSEGL